ncbi:hypothetical protein DM877_11130 [Enterobacter cloacae]|uniref:Uncharacterized protein n=1 Tax=Enterobacter cloacae TaxID=550 RepID=A0A4Q2E8D5_ENTCL|nr:hypothetical protein [Enterobacter cloacae]RXW28953.1 hypothetical protein DM877_11130 [Enterobacter cloacae]
MKKFGPMLAEIFNLVHYLPDGTTKSYPIKVCKHPDPDGTRYATYENGVSLVLTKTRFERIRTSQGKNIRPCHMSHKLIESLNLA